MQTSPVYFAWVDPEETTFGPEHHVWDEQLESAIVEHEEGDVPKLTVVMRNPGPVGLLNPSRKRYAWLAYDDNETVIPIFFGRVNAIPGNIFEEMITIIFTAEPNDFVAQKRRLARQLRVPPFYDPIFIEDSRRDDPDAVLEGYSKLWHIDRISGEVTVSDIITAEDGIENFEAEEVPFDSVQCEIGENPITVVTLDSTVTWNQRHSGTVTTQPTGTASYSSAGDPPDAGSSIGGGWSVKNAYKSVANGAESAISVSWEQHWKTTRKRHAIGDSLTVDISVTEPTSSGISIILTEFSQPGYLDPFAKDEDGDPAPINRPIKYNNTSLTVVLWNETSSVNVLYEADRERSERVMIKMRSDLQPSIVDDVQTDRAEIIEVSGGDVGVPILTITDWVDLRDSPVSIGDVIFPEYEQFPGIHIAQICTTAGTTGLTEPDFSPIEGFTTADGTAVWTSMGETSPSETPEDWTPDTEVPLGDIIMPSRNNLIPTYSELMAKGLTQYPQQGTDVSVGQIVRAANGSYQKCIVAGMTRLRSAPRGFALPNDVGGSPSIPLHMTASEPPFSTVWGATLIDGGVQWMSLGMTIPTGTAHFICIQAGTTGQHLPSFSETIGTVTVDGTAQWTCIGTGEIPIGGSPGNTPRSAFFPTPRGNQALEYLICVGRAFLLNKARCISVSFEIPFLRALELSCRKSAFLEHDKIPGGSATGKITNYKIVMKNDGKFYGTVKIMCAVGNGATVSEVLGTPVYVSVTYVGPDYQRFTGNQIIVPDISDITYTPPVATVVDDGLTFPLDYGQAIISDRTRGSLDDQALSIGNALEAAKKAAQLSEIQPTDKMQATSIARELEALGEKSVDKAIAAMAITREVELMPVTGGPYDAFYSIETSDLMIPKHIDLEG